MIPLQDTKTSGHFPIQTILLIAVTIYVFYLQLTTPDIERFLYAYALVPRLVDFSDPATLSPLITATFLHGGFLHIASNMLFLWVFGDNIEERLKGFYVPFYLLGGIVAGLAQYWIQPNSLVPMLGASGAIAAVLGAYMVWYPHHRVKTLVPIFFFITLLNIPAGILLIYWFVVQLFSGVGSVGVTSATEGGVAYFAHIGGFVFGALVALVLGRREREESGREQAHYIE